MPTAAAMSPNDHQQIRLLLPWYVNRTLEASEHQRVDTHVRACLACHRELVALRRLADAAAARSDTELAADASFARLSARLPRRQPHALSDAGSLASSRGRWQALALRRALPFALAASIAIGVLPVLLSTDEPGDADAPFRTLSSDSALQPPAGELRVVFAPSVPATRVESVLAELGAKQTGPANSAGAITVSLERGHAQADVDRAILALRARGDVVLAEAVTPP